MKLIDLIKSSKENRKKQYAVLIDPDKISQPNLIHLASEAVSAKVDYFFVGGSLLTNDVFEETITTLKSHCSIPVVIFPGDTYQLSKHADALLLLSLISGRNAEMLIGKHVSAAPYIRNLNIETLPTGYMLIDTGTPTTAFYMSQTLPIPASKGDIAASTAMAGEMLGLQALYMDGGSGTKKPIPAELIQKVRKQVKLPLIIGGGITTPEAAISACKAGADIVVTGNIIEKNPALMAEMAQAIHNL